MKLISGIFELITVLIVVFTFPIYFLVYVFTVIILLSYWTSCHTKNWWEARIDEEMKKIKA